MASMYYRSLFPRDVFAELDRLQREIQQSFDVSPSIRGLARGYPALNVGNTPSSVDIFAFAAGIDPASIDVQLEKGILTIADERAAGDCRKRPRPAFWLSAFDRIADRTRGPSLTSVVVPVDPQQAP